MLYLMVIIIVGLGPGDPRFLTQEAWEVLSAAREIYARMARHPTLAGLPAELPIHTFDSIYEQAASFSDVYAHIVERVRAETCDQILITHGTDTMLDTAAALQSIPGKTMVLTGAMQPARFHRTDAIFNIGFALAAVQLLPVGAYVAMNGQIFRPGQAHKNVAAGRFEKLAE